MPCSGVPFPMQYVDGLKLLIVGLTNDPKRLSVVRKTRQIAQSDEKNTSHSDIDPITEEVRDARRLFARNGWPVIDVTRRSIEETAAAVIQFYTSSQSHSSERRDPVCNLAVWPACPGFGKCDRRGLLERAGSMSSAFPLMLMSHPAAAAAENVPAGETVVLAEMKVIARQSHELAPGQLLLAADQILELDGAMLGKPVAVTRQPTSCHDPAGRGRLITAVVMFRDGTRSGITLPRTACMSGR